MVCPPATSEAEARWPRFGLVVVATNSRRDYLDQMIRPQDTGHVHMVRMYSCSVHQHYQDGRSMKCLGDCIPETYFYN
jgi:hypothetical protein